MAVRNERASSTLCLHGTTNTRKERYVHAVSRSRSVLVRFLEQRMCRDVRTCLIVHTTASRSGAYFTVPTDVLKEGVSASDGTGITISTLFAVERCLNCDFALIMYSMREFECGSTTASIQSNGFTYAPHTLSRAAQNGEVDVREAMQHAWVFRR